MCDIGSGAEPGDWLGDLGERCELSQWDLGGTCSRKRNLVLVEVIVVSIADISDLGYKQ